MNKTMPNSSLPKSRATFAQALAITALCSLLFTFTKGCTPPEPVTSLCTPPQPSKLVIVIEENSSYESIIGNLQAPYINRLASEGANFTQSYAITHPSQPNYLALFSGSTHGIFNDSTYPHTLFTDPNLGSKLLDAGFTFGGYSESLPAVGWDNDTGGDELTGFYKRKHNPWVNWQDSSTPLGTNKLPPSVNMPFLDFPTNFDELPDVSIVVPNQRHDMHDGTLTEADTWLQQNLGSYVEWAKTNNGLLILTWDEGDGSDINHIVTVFHGPMVNRGQFGDIINHFSVLRTIEDMFNLPHDAGTITTGPVQCDVWQTTP